MDWRILNALYVIFQFTNFSTCNFFFDYGWHHTLCNDSLDKLSKQDLIPIVLSLQSKLDEANNKVLEEERNLPDTITTLSSELSITKNVNTLLWSRLVTLKRQCLANAQYSRRECLGILGIPREVSGEVLEEVLNIFDKLGCSISPDHIESCHRISKKSNTVIVKFSQRKDQKHLQKLKMEDVDLPGINKLFINRNLCPYYKVLWSKSKKLLNLVKNHVFVSLVRLSKSKSMKVVLRSE